MTPMNRVSNLIVPVIAVCLLANGSVQAQLDIVINPGANLSANAPALAAFERAAQSWEAIFTDNITITVDADFGTFTNPLTIGATSSVALQNSYDAVRSLIVADGLTGDDRDDVVAFLPTFSQLNTAVSYTHLTLPTKA